MINHSFSHALFRAGFLFLSIQNITWCRTANESSWCSQIFQHSPVLHYTSFAFFFPFFLFSFFKSFFLNEGLSNGAGGKMGHSVIKQRGNLVWWWRTLINMCCIAASSLQHLSSWRAECRWQWVIAQWWHELCPKDASHLEISCTFKACFVVVQLPCVRRPKVPRSAHTMFSCLTHSTTGVTTLTMNCEHLLLLSVSVPSWLPGLALKEDWRFHLASFQA